MDLSTIDQALIVARGHYATVNGAYKDTMESMQKAAQKACDHLRLALQDEKNSANHIAQVEMLTGMLGTLSETANELREQKDALKVLAWGDK